ncbi:MAG TPA: adenylate/guanylate cyclase domain-containing protein [Candidatus Limnocylindria bacterium]|nr:adenylate/guanylate cyclase domain-containing protein [Candidatus Limnocylindria bacterium]
MTTEQRKLVSVVFADVVGSTAFGSDNDPEAVRSVMGSYFERMKAIAEMHGGTVEKFIGDAVMIVFGVPRLHDDDAERAVRAALAMRDAMADLNRELGVTLAARIGVNSGEAVAGSGVERQFLVTGDAVNVAARLQQGAEPGEVVVGALTESLTRSAIEYAPRDAVAAKGKSEPLGAFRAVRPRSAVPEQARGLPQMRAQLVGRQRELRLLLDTFERVRTERRAHLFTLVGNAGIGKSRLVGEVLARVASGGGARVLRGRCLPYGAGITYWPLMEIVREDAGIASDDDRETAIAKLDRRTAEVAEATAASLRNRLAAMLGLRTVEEAIPEVRAPDVSGEIAWAVREYLVAAAREPLVVVVDDLQWAEPAVFDIVEGVAERAEDAPLLLLCVARPTLLETHPGWAAGRANAATITLDALSADETTTLIARLLDVDDLPDDLRARVVERSEGNPLFCEEFLRMLIDEGRVVRVEDRWRAAPGAADVRVPESIHALIAARIDGLGEDERRVIQIASIVGERFAVSELRALAPDLDVAPALTGLRRAGIVLEDRETREPGHYRFKHLLMRDVAYAGMSKAARADLHEAFARELERSVGDRREEFAEILAYHAERAFTLSVEVRAARAVIEPRARVVLDNALQLGERARRRRDLGLIRPHSAAATAALAALGAAASAEDRLSVQLLQANEQLLNTSYREAVASFTDATRVADELGRKDLSAQARLGAAGAYVWSAGSAAEIEALVRNTEEAAQQFRELGDTGSEIECGLIALDADWASGDLPRLLEKGRILRERAREIGDGARELLLCARLAPAAGQEDRWDLFGEYIARANELVARLGARAPSWLRVTPCGKLRSDGDLNAALACLEQVARDGRVEHDPTLEMPLLRGGAEIEAIERRRYTEAAAYADKGLELSVRTGERWNRAELTGTRAICTAASGDVAGAERQLADAYALADRGDVFAIAHITHCKARVLELAGRDADAEAAFGDAERHYAQSGYTRGMWHAQVLLDLAHFLADRGRAAEAQERLDQAVALFTPQVGERAERIAKLRERIAAARAQPA